MDKVRILFLAANPQETKSLQLDKEAREIEHKIQSSRHRDIVEFVTKWAVRTDDLMQALLETEPQVLHFSGHGTSEEAIILVDENDASHEVTKEAMQHLLLVLTDNLRVVVLNACYSREQAATISECIDCCVGMNETISDRAAIIFAGSFYRALGFGRSVQQAFELGICSLKLEGVPEDQTPELLVRSGVDASQVFLVTQPSSTPTDTERGGPKIVLEEPVCPHTGTQPIGGGEPVIDDGERQIYNELWNRLFDFRIAAHNLVDPLQDRVYPDPMDKFIDALNAYQAVVRRNEPFIVSQVYEPARAIVSHGRDIAASLQNHQQLQTEREKCRDWAADEQIADKMIEEDHVQQKAAEEIDRLFEEVDHALRDTFKSPKRRSQADLSKSTDVPLSIIYDRQLHFDKANQIIAFDVTMPNSPRASRVQQIRVRIESLIATRIETDPRQMGVQFTGHELAPMREPESRGFRLDPGGQRTIRFVWSSPEDEYIYFSGYDPDGVYQEAGFKTLKSTYVATVHVESRNGTPVKAVFSIGCKENGELTFEQIS